MFIYTQTQYPRRGWEKVFMQLYNITIVAQISAIVIAFSDFADRIDSTFVNFWLSPTVTLSPSLVTVMTNCTYNGVFKGGGYSAASSMTLDAAPMPFIFFTLFTFGSFIIYGILIIIIIFAQLMHTWNVRHLRIRGLRIQLNCILQCHILGLSICMIVLLFSTIDVRAYLNDYVLVCAANYARVHGTALLEAEYATNVVFGTNLNWCLACIIINMCVCSLAITFLMHNSMSKSLGRFESAVYPWQNGFLGRPNKLELVYYTRQRNELLQELEADPTIDARTMGAFPFPNTYALQEQHKLMQAQRAAMQSMQQHDPLQHVAAASAISRQQQRRLLEQHAAAQYDAGEYEEDDEQALQDNAVDGEEFNPDDEEMRLDGGADPIASTNGQQRQTTMTTTAHRRRRHHRRDSPVDDSAGAGGEQPLEEGGEDGERRHRRRHRRRRDKLDEQAPLESNE